ncbi:MAG: amidohydrolase [Spirochaetota bacterium]|nr:MAG: amidohydrolase [Spirochaetota bacterium]
MTPSKLKKMVRDILPDVISLRHTLHAFPEIMFEEHTTRKILMEALSDTDLKFLPAQLDTSIVALLAGDYPGANVTLRADMDALPIKDMSNNKWRSRNDGKSHACGHDGHMAILMGTIKVLMLLRDQIHGSVRFVFQPGEEGGGGGKQMVMNGLLEQEPKASAVFALHVWPDIPVGIIATMPGPMMAAADTFTVAVKGSGGHGAKPHVTVDPIVISAQIIQSLQTIPSRIVNPVDPVVVSVCSIQGGNATNVIPDSVIMKGTTRYFDNKLKKKIQTEMERIIRGICQAAGARYEFDYEEGYTPLVNDEDMVKSARNVVETYLGKDKWMEITKPSMGAEDFSYYLMKAPGAFFFLGVGEDSHKLHTSQFDFNDDAIENGILLLSAMTLETLNKS